MLRILDAGFGVSADMDGLCAEGWIIIVRREGGPLIGAGEFVSGLKFPK